MTTFHCREPVSINKILIANRGEIACRIIRTARARGIETVAVYSDADARALHVQLADSALHIGGSASADSYLRIDAIVDAAKQAGVDAIHPGFGFLSENAGFANALAAAGIGFIGPRPHAIEVMGDKIESKKLAQQAKVNVVPGHTEAVADADAAYVIAESIGCPVMLKASAGGGGKGMRVANSLGDDRVFVEKFIERPRHIEIQVIADSHGNCVYLGERECSIQRRHQKVIEEAPSAFISDTTRKAMGEQAVALANAVDYVSAGTVEFIVDAQEQFYFLEMNTRLQVEHPVTECITGLDLVGLMIDVAAGHTLPFTQKDIVLNGWAFEARIYAEDPDRGFLPSTGRLTHYAPPTNTSGVGDTHGDGASSYIRVDPGIQAGGEISMFYDPMIAKLVTWAPTRDQALTTMLEALDDYRIEGVHHNVPFLSALFAHPAFQAGDLTTRFIEDHFPTGFNSRDYAAAQANYLPRIAAWLEQACRQRDHADQNHTPLADPTQVPPVRLNTPTNTGDSEPQQWCVIDATTRHEVPAHELAGVVSDWRPGDWLFEGTVDNCTLRVAVNRLDDRWRLSCRGSVRELRVLEPHVVALLDLMPQKQSHDLSRFLLSPMPGLLMNVLVNVGDSVTIGQDLAVVEAMKMENTLRAEINGTVKEITAATGDSLAVDAVILEFE